MRLSPVHLPTHCDTSATRTWASLVPVSSSGLVEGKVCRLIDDGWLACFPPHIPDGSPLYPQAAHRGPKTGFQLRQRPIGSRDRTWGGERSAEAGHVEPRGPTMLRIAVCAIRTVPVPAFQPIPDRRFSPFSQSASRHGWVKSLSDTFHPQNGLLSATHQHDPRQPTRSYLSSREVPGASGL
jgi:hypothetical protein